MRIRIRLRRNGQAVDSVLLPKDFAWCEASEPDATLWIRQVRNAWTQGSTLKAAVETVTQTSDKHGDDLGVTWSETVESFRDSVVAGRNQIRAETWRDNYQPYLKEALQLLGSSNKPEDGFTLLKRTLRSERANAHPASPAAWRCGTGRITASADSAFLGPGR